MTKIVTASSLLKASLTDEELRALEDSDSESWHFCFRVQKGHRVFIESTASQTMEGLLPLKVDAQARLFETIAETIPEPGDSMVIENDKNGGKQRSAFITRLKPPSADDPDVYLLITR